jgi:hypothetical protein
MAAKKMMRLQLVLPKDAGEVVRRLAKRQRLPVSRLMRNIILPVVQLQAQDTSVARLKARRAA